MCDGYQQTALSGATITQLRGACVRGVAINMFALCEALVCK